ncbi:hypothetical protein [Flavobacterium tyrosinilyticum]|uniref:hypothetical protein n=1 Tax=Flavobacterium tyrosinilyticum TaxID=1658740 RepID=UPI00202F1788|nr:hypothetical protein [Flavobacterium tyrosinilyticum]MCM0665514.1 hypothetical protein [Flavobacterium tyrosinilyticum]
MKKMLILSCFLFLTSCFAKKEQIEHDEDISVQSLYRKALDQYFLEKLDLKKYDSLLATSKLRFIIRTTERQNVYQQTSTLSLNYIYFRNNIYIERLDRKTLDFLQSRIDNYKLNVDDELIKVVRETYSKIVKMFPEEKSSIKVLYSKNDKKIAFNNAVVFEIAHQSEFDEEGNYVSRENEARKKTYLKEELIPHLEMEFSEKLSCPVTIFIEE